MELLQNAQTGEYFIKTDGTFDANPSLWIDRRNDIGAWANKGLELTDGKIVKQQVRRIVELQEGPNLDAKVLSLEEVEYIPIAGKELLFDLVQSTLVPAYMTTEEYEEARVYRQHVSKLAREARWDSMIKKLTNPSVLANQGKLAFIALELLKYKEDYVIADNKIFESFISATDHPLGAIPTYPRDIKFGTDNSNLALDNLALWDDPVLGGEDENYKSLVIDAIHCCILHADHYITE